MPAPRPAIHIQITGLPPDTPEDTRETLDRMLQRSLQRTARITPPLSLRLHIKTYRPHGRRAKYTLRAHLQTPRGPLTTQGWDWDLRDAAAQCLDSLEKRIIQKKQMQKRKGHNGGKPRTPRGPSPRRRTRAKSDTYF